MRKGDVVALRERGFRIGGASPMPRHSATRPARDRKAGRRDWEISPKMDDVLARAARDFENDARRRRDISKNIENEIEIA